MVTILKNKTFFLCLTALVFLISCNDGVAFSEYKSLPDATWEANKNISFQFEIVDTISPKNLFINIRNNSEYPFSNLYIITELNFPNSNKVIDTLQYEMTDNVGNYLGKGFTEIKENKLFYKENKVFPASGNYQLNVRHAMRKSGEIGTIEFLEGIQDIGLSIENSK